MFSMNPPKADELGSIPRSLFRGGSFSGWIYARAWNYLDGEFTENFSRSRTDFLRWSTIGELIVTPDQQKDENF